jgi:endonuclease G, mitochondrial
MATIPVNPILKHPTNLLVNSGQIDATKKRLDFDPSEKRKDLRFKKPVENESGERVAARFMTAAMEGMGSLQLERIIKGNDLMSVNYLQRGTNSARSVARVIVRGGSPEMLKKVALNQQANNAEAHVLPYHHFSVVVNRERKLSYVTAVNIDGSVQYRVKRDRDQWFPDPRIEKNAQAGPELYKKNDLDFGHLVRRLDPAWGRSEALAIQANDDTFHLTNCSPQHKDFNRNQATWAGLEDYILDHADNEQIKVTVFTAPVLTNNDPFYREIQIPVQFFKVVVMPRQNGRLSATAYLLSQAMLIHDLRDEEFRFGPYKTFQVPIRKIERLTGLGFGNLRQCDPLNDVEHFEAIGVREIANLSEIRL